jgi:hypothetical protein
MWLVGGPRLKRSFPRLVAGRVHRVDVVIKHFQYVVAQ